MELQEMDTENAIAIVGFSGQFPGGSTPEEFWKLIESGRDAIETLSHDELLKNGVPYEWLGNGDYVSACSRIPDIDKFDAGFFRCSPIESRVMDPQHRLLLQHAYKTFESAGHIPSDTQTRTGVFVGVGLNAYLLNNVIPQSSENSAFDIQISSGSDKSYAATRIAHKLNLKGPCVAIDTACSTSLVCVHMACQSLLNYESDRALVGACNLALPDGRGYFYQPGGVYSRDGHCRPFDKNASGTLMASGVGAVLLVRLEDAINNGDNILGIICGTAVNNDGADKIDFAAPSAKGQSEVISTALAIARVDASAISYIETHGTGTALGDSIELAALNKVFSPGKNNRKQACALGALKGNLGHLNIAAGIAGLIKILLMFEKHKLPPMPNFESANPNLEFDPELFEFNTASKVWNCFGPRLAGLSSFGVGGTNAHIILREYIKPKVSVAQIKYHLLPISAMTADALTEKIQHIGHHLLGGTEQNISNQAYTLQTGREAMAERVFVVAENNTAAGNTFIHDAQLVLSAIKRVSPELSGSLPRVAFVFSGQGSQYLGMGAELYRSYPGFKYHFDRCAKIVDSLIGCSLYSLLFNEQEEYRLDKTEFTQPALFVIQYSLAQCWQELDIQPSAVIGHSVGEYVAACVAGVISLEDALAIICKRGQLIAQLDSGAMLSLAIGIDHVKNLLLQYSSLKLDIAVINSSTQLVVSGTIEAINQFQQIITEQNIVYKRLNTSHAFHSRMMDPILEGYREFLQQFTFNSAKIPIISNITGAWHKTANNDWVSYWVSHLREKVDFAQGLKCVASEFSILLDIGPSAVMAGMARQNELLTQIKVINAMPRRYQEESEYRIFLTALGKLWQEGCKPKWLKLYPIAPMKVALPTYPFEKKRHWLEPAQGLSQQLLNADTSLATGNIKIYSQAWQQDSLITFHSQTGNAAEIYSSENIFVVFSGKSDFAARFSDHLYRQDLTVLFICEDKIQADELRENVPYRIYDWSAQATENDLWTWVETLREGRNIEVIYCPPIDEMPESECTYKQAIYPLYYNPLILVNKLALLNCRATVNFLTQDAVKVMSYDNVNPIKSLVQGPFRVIPQEFSLLDSRHIDIDCMLTDIPSDDQLQLLLDEIVLDKLRVLPEAQSGEKPVRSSIAYREGQRWSEKNSEICAVKGQNEFSDLKPGGHYIVLGGLSSIGRLLLSNWFRGLNAKLILVGREVLAERLSWQGLADLDPIAYRVYSDLLELEKTNQVNYVSLDLCDKNAIINFMDKAHLDQSVDGVFHFAGNTSQNLITLKPQPLYSLERESDYQIFAAKLSPLWALEEWQHTSKLDFVFLASSLSAWSGGPGMVDYSSANHMLSTFAKVKGHPYRAIAWEGWHNLGMLANRESKLFFNGWFKEIIIDDELITAKLSAAASKLWPITEHRLQQKSLAPATAIIDIFAQGLASALNVVSLPEKNVCVSDLSLILPLYADALAKGKIELHLRKKSLANTAGVEAQWAAVIQSDTYIYATALVSLKNNNSQLKDYIDIAPLCNTEKFSAYNQLPAIKSGQLHLGPHWHSLEKICIDKSCLLAQLKLNFLLAQDVENFLVHPALFDLALVTAALLIQEQKAIYLPAQCAEILILRPFPSNVFVKVELKSLDHREARLDILIADDEGFVCVKVSNFVLKSIKPTENLSGEKSNNDMQGLVANDAISASNLAFSLTNLSSVIICQDKPLNYQNRWLGLANRPITLGLVPLNAEEERKRYQSFGDISVAGRTVVDIWIAQLGLDDLTPNANFFDLGGDSLSANQIAIQIRNQLKCDVNIKIVFECPTPALLIKYIDGAIQGGNVNDFMAQQVIGKASEKNVLASAQQQRLWYLAQIDAVGHTYNIPVTLKVQGLSVEKLKGELIYLLRRHHIFKTQFEQSYDGLLQVETSIEHHDILVLRLSNELPEVKSQLVQKTIKEISEFNFDLNCAPLVRAAIVEIDDGTSLLTVNIHHIIFDHWSIELLFKEFKEQLRGNKVIDPDLQYRDYAHWKNNFLSENLVKKQLDYWKNKLDDVPEHLPLPFDCQRNAENINEGAGFEYRLPASLVEQLQNFAKKRNVSLYVLLLAAFKIALYKISGETHIAVGTPVANRDLPELQSMLGFFANTLVLYDKIAVQKTFDEWLRDVNNTALSAYENQDVDFQQIVSALHISPNLLNTPIIQVIFVLQKSFTADTAAEENFTLDFLDQSTQSAKFDLALSLYHQADGDLLVAVEYRKQLFTISRVEEWLDMYVTILNKAIQISDVTIARLISTQIGSSDILESTLEEIIL